MFGVYLKYFVYIMLFTAFYGLNIIEAKAQGRCQNIVAPAGRLICPGDKVCYKSFTEMEFPSDNGSCPDGYEVLEALWDVGLCRTAEIGLPFPGETCEKKGGRRCQKVQDSLKTMEEDPKKCTPSCQKQWTRECAIPDS